MVGLIDVIFFFFERSTRSWDHFLFCSSAIPLGNEFVVSRCTSEVKLNDGSWWKYLFFKEQR